ncbi:RidA family protein [Roseibium sp.]|uniref:RidA family protein n=1 Tax=Roseibium sp. TaxID=1936156 RepID=UPI003B53000B
MERKAVNPAILYDSVQFGFSHAVESTGERLLHLSGQVAWDANGDLVGPGDLAAQAAQCFANLTEVLAQSGATAANVVRLRTYVVGYSPDKLEILGPAIAAFYGDVVPAANTLIGVQALAMPEFLIEIEATAILG